MPDRYDYCVRCLPDTGLILRYGWRFNRPYTGKIRYVIVRWLGARSWEYLNPQCKSVTGRVHDAFDDASDELEQIIHDLE